MKITRRNFLGLAAAVAILPTGLLAEAPRRSSGKAKGLASASKERGPKPTRNIYLDESGSDGDAYRTAGYLAVDVAMVKGLKRLIRRKVGEAGELKWNRITSQNIGAHEAVIDAVLTAIDSGKIQFKYSLARSSQANWPRPETDIGYSRATDTLLRDCSIEHRDSHKLYVYPQRRRSEGSLTALRLSLNRAACGRAAKSPIRLIEYRDADSSLLNQVVDVLVGALAYKANSRRSALAGNSKKHRLAELIATRIAPSSRAIG